MDGEQSEWFARRLIFSRAFEEPSLENFETVAAAAADANLAVVLGVARRCFADQGITAKEARLVKDELANSLQTAEEFAHLDAVLARAVARGESDGLETDA